MRQILLHGELGKKFGRRHKFDVRNVAESIKALCANFPGFQKFMCDSQKNGIGFRVLIDKLDMDSLSEIRNPLGHAHIRIIPVISGAGAKLRIFVGATLIAASFFTGGTTLATGLTLSGVTAAVGLSLALGGVSQLLAGNPAADEPKEKPDDKPSYLFDGPVNTTSQGHPVPIGYGRCIVGSAVISASLQIEDISNGAFELNTDQVPNFK